MPGIEPGTSPLVVSVLATEQTCQPMFHHFYLFSGSRMSDSDDVISGDSSVAEPGWQEQQQYLVKLFPSYSCIHVAVFSVYVGDRLLQGTVCTRDLTRARV